MAHQKIPDGSGISKCSQCGRDVYQVGVDPSEKDMTALIELFDGNIVRCGKCQIAFCQACAAAAGHQRFADVPTAERSKISADELGKPICPQCGGEAEPADNVYL